MGGPGAALRVPLPQSRKVRAAELASLRQSSPPPRIRDRGAASPAGALRWRHGMARYKYLQPTASPSSVVAASNAAFRCPHLMAPEEAAKKRKAP